MFLTNSIVGYGSTGTFHSHPSRLQSHDCSDERYVNTSDLNLCKDVRPKLELLEFLALACSMTSIWMSRGLLFKTQTHLLTQCALTACSSICSISHYLISRKQLWNMHMTDYILKEPNILVRRDLTRSWRLMFRWPRKSRMFHVVYAMSSLAVGNIVRLAWIKLKGINCLIWRCCK